jgi:FMN phosphatase YigB (HAD superfamily)
LKDAASHWGIETRNSMTLTILLDLDDTLLNTNLGAFIPAYFQALAKELAPQIAPDLMFRALLSGTGLMNQSLDFSQTLEEVFANDFYPQLNVPRGELDESIENFYDNIFPTLAGLTTQNPKAKPFVDWALTQGYRIAIATDPLLPRKATYHRLRWAGFEPEQFELVTSYEHFHFSKSHPAYYAEVLGRLGWPEGPVIMVGNDMERDIIPAKKLGLVTFHIVDEEAASTTGPQADFHGDLQDLRSVLESNDLSRLNPSFKSLDSISAILCSTPAVLRGLAKKVDPASWSQHTNSEEWAFTELICHLRDTEREIHQAQINLLKKENEPFIPRPDTGIWANQRKYLEEDGLRALQEYVAARKQTLDLIQSFEPAEWSRMARHAIFGPTVFLEVIGFMADHDRLHVQQAWRILQ